MKPANFPGRKLARQLRANGKAWEKVIVPSRFFNMEMVRPSLAAQKEINAARTVRTKKRRSA